MYNNSIIDSKYDHSDQFRKAIYSDPFSVNHYFFSLTIMHVPILVNDIGSLAILSFFSCDFSFFNSDI
jgi:hypothetical protein